MQNQIFNNICKIYELKGKQELYSSTYLTVLERMAKVTKIQSTKASHLIEGINILNHRLKGLVEKSVIPKNSNEKEIKGYNLALDEINEKYMSIKFNKKNVIRLHQTIFSNKDKKIKNMDNIFILYNKSVSEKINPLIYIPEIIFKLMKLRPFEDGNGRIARLLTLLLLFQNGFTIGKYVSISDLIAKTKDEYKKSIESDTDEEFKKYFLNVIRKAYEYNIERFEEITKENLTSSEKVFKQIIKEIKPISKTDIMALCPEISQRTIERALKNLQEDGKIEKIGKGKTTKYILKGEKNNEDIQE